MPDFTLKTFKLFLKSLHARDFSFQTFSGFLENPATKVAILRHDVDLNPSNSLVTARIESDLGILGSYYFRSVSQSNNPRIIREIDAMGHEIGYHYEDMSLVANWLRAKGTWHRVESEKSLVKIAIVNFEANLEKLRKIVQIKTICMHGSPMSRWDSKLLWKYYDYKDFGIIGEPYFDIDFDEVLYLTDTGRRWDGEAVSVRDKAECRVRGAIDLFDDWKVKPVHYRQLATGNRQQASGIQHPVFRSQHFGSTFDIINAANHNNLPRKMMITLHPQRWTNKPHSWLKELVGQSVKNQVKRFIVLKER